MICGKYYKRSYDVCYMFNQINSVMKVSHAVN